MENRRKHILLKNEIEMIQMVLRNEVFPREDYKLKIAERLEELKQLWYKNKKHKANGK